MRNHKQLIGILRVIACLVFVYYFDINFEMRDLKFWVSDMIHGAHTIEFRDTTSVGLVMFPILASVSYYFIQTAMYIFVGNELDGKDTSLLRFFKYVVSGIRECINDPHFWASDPGNGSLNNVEELIKYRDGKMAFMSNADAADYMKGTGHLDLMMSRPDLKQSRKALGYLNGKLAFMDNKSGLEFLKNQK
jgi:hypothetical protein